MGDTSRYSVDELKQLLAQAKQQQSLAGATHNVISADSLDPYFQNDPTEGMNTGQKLLAGTGRGMVNIGRHAANLVGLMSDEKLKNAAEIDAPLMNTRPGALGSAIGETAVTAPITMGASMGVGALGPVGSAIVNNPISRGAMEGGIQGLLNAEPGERLKGMAWGAGIGGALPALGMGARKFSTGLDATPEARFLRGAGVDLTPGQLNPEGVANTLEQSWQSVPVAGNIIRNARHNAENQFQQTVMQQGAAPGAQIATGPLDDMLDQAYASYGPAYDAARNYPVAGTRTGIARALAQTAQDPAVLADDGARNTVANWLRNQATQLPAGQSLTSADLLDLRSEIRARVRGLTDTAQRDLLENAEQQLSQHLNSQLPQDVASDLAATDAQYSRYKILENAMRKAGDRPEGFTPSQLSTAIKEATDPGAYARGGGQLRDYSSAGRDVFNTVSPATGARTAAIALPIAAAAANPAIGVPLGAAGLSLVGSQYGRQLAAGERPLQQALQSLISGTQRNLTATQREALTQALRQLSVQAGTQSAASDTGAP